MSVRPRAALELGVTMPAPESDTAGVSAPGSDPARRDRQQVDHFLIERMLGSGGMGDVYLARDVSLDRPVAIKILPAEAALKPEAQERFIREAQAQARLSSPHIVQIYFIGSVSGDAGSPRGSLYFAMEVIDGESLEAMLERGERLDSEQARQLMIQAARGLRDAHRAGLVHRDVKPGNLLLGRGGELKVADFGLAKPRDPSLGLTRTGAVMGTPLYMAPEQARGEELDHRADMYALGCTFYHLVSGAPPFDGPNVVALLSKHLSVPPPPLRERAPELPARLATIVERVMAKQAADRYASYDELIAALEAAAPETIEYAGFWTRGAAAAIDAVLGSLLITFLSWPGLVVYLAYVTIAHAYRGQTLAKYVLRIQVQRLDGGRLGLLRSLARTVAQLWLPVLLSLFVVWTKGLTELKGSIVKLDELAGVESIVGALIVSQLVLTLLYAAGFLLAAAQRQKRAVHDFIVGSRVIYRLGAPKPARSVSPSLVEDMR